MPLDFSSVERNANVQRSALSNKLKDDTELESWVSQAALAAIPMKPQFNQAGGRNREAITVATIGTAILIVGGLVELAHGIDQLIDAVAGWFD